MKRHKKSITNFALAIVAGMVVIFFSTSAKAEKSNLFGSGNFIFRSGEKEAAFYTEDIYYLQEEITALFHEMEEDENE